MNILRPAGYAKSMSVRAGLARARGEGKRLRRPPIAHALEKRIREALAIGSSNAPSHGLAGAGASAGTSKPLRPPQWLGFSSPISACSPDALPDPENARSLLSQTLRSPCAPHVRGLDPHSRRPPDRRSAAATQPFQGQDRLKRSLMNSGTQPEAVLGPGAVASCSTTTRRSTSPFR